MQHTGEIFIAMAWDLASSHGYKESRILPSSSEMTLILVTHSEFNIARSQLYTVGDGHENTKKWNQDIRNCV